jgi:CelD/BcsL family acetyltransferase involved in cellulose biosynthesis
MRERLAVHARQHIGTRGDAADCSLEVLRDAATIARALGPDAVREWRSLAESAKKVTVFQAPDFVLTWYEVYEPDYEPLLILGRWPDGRLAGVMPLATSRQHPGSLVFAGAEHAEYAGWVADISLEEEFPAACVAHLRDLGLFRGTWRWKWLGPGTGLGWLEHPALRSRGIAAHVRETVNPVLVLNHPDTARYFAKSKKNYRRKMNRLRASGEVRLLQLDADTLTGELFERLTTIYDVRQCARYGVAPFAEDPLKGPFHRRLIERAPASARLFALVAGPEPVAFHFTVIDRLRAIYCMSPFDHRYLSCSPGKLISDLVADALAERGIDEIDLTPGGEYKEELANKRETLHAPTLFASRRQARVVWAREAARRRLRDLARRLGMTREQLERGRALVARARGRSPLALAAAGLRAVRRWAWSRDVMRLYRIDRSQWIDDPAASRRVEIQKNRLEAFLRYSGSSRWHSRQHVIGQATRRLEGGEHCYTIVQDGVLAHSAWLQLGAEAITLSEIGAAHRLPPNSGVLYDAYTEPAARGRGLHGLSLRQRVRDAFAMGADRVFIASQESNRASLSGIEASGFRLDRRLIRVRILGLTRRWAAPVP